MNEFKKNVRFHDNNWTLFNIECEITLRNWYQEFSMSWDWWWSLWQNEDSINPRTDNQRKLLDLWDNWHLNWMSAGTEKQMKLLRDYKITSSANDYDQTCDYLRKHKFDWSELTITEYDKSEKAIKEYKENLGAFNSMVNSILKQSNETIVIYKPESELEMKYFTEFITILWDDIIIKDDKILQSLNRNRSPAHDKLKQAINSIDIKYSKDLFISSFVDMYKWNPYLYWHGWVIKTLPSDFKSNLEDLIKEIISEELLYDNVLIKEEDLEEEFFQDKVSELNIDENKLMAICLKFKLWRDWLQDLEKWYWDCYFKIEWNDYLVCTDDEADEKHLEDIKSLVDDIWWEWFKWWNDIDVELDDNWDIIISKSITIPQNERWNSLNRYDWYEDYYTFGDTFYFYRQ